MKWESILKAGPWGVRNGNEITYNGELATYIQAGYLKDFTIEANIKSVESMLNSVWESNKEKLEYNYGNIIITGESGNEYRLPLDDSGYCKFNVLAEKDTNIGFLDVSICIDIPAENKKPYGDILATYILALINDNTSSENIDTLDYFLGGWYDSAVECDFCIDVTEFGDIDELQPNFTCGYCGVFSCELEIREGITPGNTTFELRTYNERFDCPYCGGDVELEYNRGRYAVCETDRMIIDTNGHFFAAMRIDGILQTDIEPDADDEEIIIYNNKRYRYTNGIEGELIEGEE